ncbi:hypothetical protein AVEN_117936-1 [Araneus ventricosus]|uniref:Uncharacterized protein n=1 Tax=Araneus ventricosus TaxID=182803 RepID=A0A4Y2KRU8_ARAVE|nr:hypothetical protein AVEN_117936-1 [Araneus ventricosus]
MACKWTFGYYSLDMISFATRFQNTGPVHEPCAHPCCCDQLTGPWAVWVVTFLSHEIQKQFFPGRLTFSLLLRIPTRIDLEISIYLFRPPFLSELWLLKTLRAPTLQRMMSIILQNQNDVDNLSALEIIQVLRKFFEEKCISSARTFGEKFIKLWNPLYQRSQLLRIIKVSTTDKHPESYSEKVKKGPHTVLLYPAQNTDEQAERNKTFSVKHLLESSIHPLKDKIKFKDVRKIRNQSSPLIAKMIVMFRKSSPASKIKKS